MNVDYGVIATQVSYPVSTSVKPTSTSTWQRTGGRNAVAMTGGKVWAHWQCTECGYKWWDGPWTIIPPGGTCPKCGGLAVVIGRSTISPKAKVIALGITGAILLGFSSWAAGDAWRRTHSRGRAFGAFLTPPVWLLTR